MKNNCALFSHTPLFSGPGYKMVSFKFLACRALGYIAWQWDRYLVPQYVFLVYYY